MKLLNRSARFKAVFGTRMERPRAKHCGTVEMYRQINMRCRKDNQPCLVEKYNQMNCGNFDATIVLNDKIAQLSPRHQNALLWFCKHQGREIQWPRPMPDDIFLANKATNVHIPAGWHYALSVRQSLDESCYEAEPVLHVDGSWTCHYCQEQSIYTTRENTSATAPLLACQQDEIPVGVLRQTKGKRDPRYRVLGVALVRQWKNGCFLLEGFGPSGIIGVRSSEVALTFSQGGVNNGLDLASIEDGHQRINESIARRRGHGEFRDALLAAYGKRCALSSCDVPDALDAAYIFRYVGDGTHTINNGILLRSDIHTLYDLGLIAVDPFSLKVVTAPALKNTDYGYLAEVRLRLPIKTEHRPNRAALEMHLKWAEGTWR